MEPVAGITALRTVLGHRFRANPAFELLERDRLPERLRSDLAGGSSTLADGVVLVPRSAGDGAEGGRPDGGITAKILNVEATALIRSLTGAGHLPGDVAARGGDTNRAIARLVLDGALEIEHGDRMVSGPPAHAAIFTRAARPPASGRLAALSRQALRYGQALRMTDVRLLSRRLYGFGTIPRHARWDLLMETADDVVGMLGLTRDGRAGRILSADYEATTYPNWLSWLRATDRPDTRPDLHYKLYVSPRPEAMVECFPAVVAVLADMDVWSFKVGRGVLGLLRPDKIVAYFEDADRLHRVARALARALDGCPAQGVPFTAESSVDGLVSWGIDPPPSEQVSASQPRQSWRYWIANQLASGLIHAQAAGGGLEPWEFAVDRLSLEGVDPETWLPADTIWQDAEVAS